MEKEKRDYRKMGAFSRKGRKEKTASKRKQSLPVKIQPGMLVILNGR